MKKLFVFIIAILGFSVPCKGMEFLKEHQVPLGAAAAGAASVLAVQAGLKRIKKPDYVKDAIDLDSIKSNFEYLKIVADVLSEEEEIVVDRLEPDQKLDVMKKILCKTFRCANIPEDTAGQVKKELLTSKFNKKIEEEGRFVDSKIKEYLSFFDKDKIQAVTLFEVTNKPFLTGDKFREVLESYIGDNEEGSLEELLKEELITLEEINYIKYLILRETYKQVRKLYDAVDEKGLIYSLKTCWSSPYTKALMCGAAAAGAGATYLITKGS